MGLSGHPAPATVRCSLDSVALHTQRLQVVRIVYLTTKVDRLNVIDQSCRCYSILLQAQLAKVLVTVEDLQTCLTPLVIISSCSSLQPSRMAAISRTISRSVLIAILFISQVSAANTFAGLLRS
jgi:hypothetical protein